MKNKYLIIALSIVSFNLFAQIHRCSTDEYLQQQIEKDPQIKINMEQLDEYIRLNTDLIKQNKNSSVVTIPVVYHVIYRNSTENINDNRLMEQIAILNQDYRKLNADTTNTPAVFKPFAADIEIEFCLAKRDPNGNPHSGINRVPTTVTSFSTDDKVKGVKTGGAAAWDASKYLNIWVCNLGSDLLGYAQFPGGGGAATDGVVLHYKYTGKTGATAPFNKGRTATHEVGHWLGLYHTFQGGCSGTSSTNCATQGDGVCDTPPTSAARYGCPSVSTVHNTCTETPTDYRDMTMNYMDYVDDGCMNLFTLGQKTRMIAVMNGIRSSLLTSNGCVPVPVFTNDAGIKSIISPENGICTNTVSPKVILKNYSNTTLTSATIKYKVGANGSENDLAWSGSLTPNAETTVQLNSVTVNNNDTLYAYTNTPNGNADEKTSNDLAKKVIELFTTSTNPPVVNNFSTTSLASGWSVQDVDNDGRVWTRTTVGGFTGGNSFRFNNFTSPDYRGQLDHFLSPTVNMVTSNPKATLSFYVAYAPYSTSFNDTLIVASSTDCGETWTNIYKKGGTNLQTSTATTSAYSPGSTASNWRRDTVDISNLIGQNNARFRFTNKSGYGNYLYVDDINIYTYLVSGIAKESLINNKLFEVYPNPATEKLFINQLNSKTAKVNIHNIFGQIVIEQNINSETNEIDINNLSSGSYIITISSGNEINKFKFTKN